MKKGVAFLIILAVFFSAITLYFSIFQISIITGHVSTGSVSLYISGEGPTFTIHSPLNVTYNFASPNNLYLDLNVSSPSNVVTWNFKLEDLYHNSVINSSVDFTPNTTFSAVRRSNKLTVYATDAESQISSKSVIFYVSVPNSAPLLGNISSDLYVCEASSLSYEFNATDIDEESLVVSISPTDPFFVYPNIFYGSINIVSELFSSVLGKSDLGNYNRTISVTDGQYSDSKNVSITVIEINNAPSVGNIGVQTVYTKGEGINFTGQLQADDVEDGDQDSGNLSMNISFNGGQILFNISSNGTMFFRGNSSYVGVHNITVCATDLGLPSISQNASYCGETGLNKTSCSNFSLTVTDKNRHPTITSYSPSELNFSALGNTVLEFNITTYDPDGTFPDVYWYRDGGLALYSQGSLNYSYSLSYPCGVSGLRTIKAVVTDGVENDSITWNVTLISSVCPIASVSSGGGGGGGGPSCFPKWGCNEWTICQHTETSLELGILSGEDYREINYACLVGGLDSNSCGFQTRSCFDNNFCNLSSFKPDAIQFCNYVSDPSCSDGLKNCHGGLCELLIDCGGPCSQCPSCSDGVSNQGELGIDCGGPCPFVCPAETPFIEKSILRTIYIWAFWLLLIILLVILIRKVIRLIEIHRELQKESKIQSVLSK